MPLTSPSEWAAGKFPTLHARLLTDNLLQKSSGGGDQAMSAGVTFSSAVTFSTAASVTVNAAQTFNGAVTFASSAAFNGATTIGNATADTLAINAGVITLVSGTQALINGNARLGGNIVVGTGTANTHTLNGKLAMASNGQFRIAPAATITCQSTTQGSSTALTEMFNILTTAAAGTDDSVRLPVASTGTMLIVMNQGGGTANVFPATSGTINGGGANGGVKVNPLAARLFIGHSDVNWASLNGAV